MNRGPRLLALAAGLGADTKLILNQLSEIRSSKAERGELGVLSQALASLGDAVDIWNYEYLAADVTENAVALKDAFVGFTPEANKTYEIEVVGAILSAAATTGFQSQLSGPTGTTWSTVKITTAATASTDLITHTALNTMQAALNGLTTENLYILRSLVKYGATPTAGSKVRLQFRSEVAASVVTMRAGSYMRWRVVAG